jgi:hypothetical protein
MWTPFLAKSAIPGGDELSGGLVRLNPVAAAAVVVLVLFSAATESSAVTDDEAGGADGRNHQELRGVEREQKDGSHTLKTAGNVLLFVPRTLVDGLLYSAVYGGQLIDDSNAISSIEEIFTGKGRAAGWFPVITAGSGPAIGLGLFYRSDAFGVTAKGAYGNQDRWAAKLGGHYSLTTGHTVWNLQVAGEILKRDNYEFHGFGSDPGSDPRNDAVLGTSQEFVSYAQELRRAPVTIGVRPSSDWQAFYTFYYQDRKLELPAVDEMSEKQIYNEVALRFDTRDYKDKVLPGVRIEGYGGQANGIGDYQARFVRAGVDASGYVPIIKKNRLIIPRVVFDMIDSRKDDAPVSFADYPRQPTFRGVSGATILRTDKYSMVPSLEYQWPLTFNLSCGVFVDYLLVAGSLDGFTFSDAPYAVGVDISIDSVESEMARLTVASGSEGLHFLFTLGLPQRVTDRKAWQ